MPNLRRCIFFLSWAINRLEVLLEVYGVDPKLIYQVVSKEARKAFGKTYSAVECILAHILV